MTSKNYYVVRNQKLRVFVDEPLMPGQTRLMVKPSRVVEQIDSMTETRLSLRKGRLGTFGEDLNGTMQEPLLQNLETMSLDPDDLDENTLDPTRKASPHHRAQYSVINQELSDLSAHH